MHLCVSNGGLFDSIADEMQKKGNSNNAIRHEENMPLFLKSPNTDKIDYRHNALLKELYAICANLHGKWGIEMKGLIEQLFANLDTWRHFPAYQLERRADIFFSIYLPEYLRSECGYDVQSIIPEFPIRVGTIHSKKEINKSFKVDYLVKVRQPSSVLFIELKTDAKSCRDKQDWYLNATRKAGMQSLLRGLQQIYRATTSKDKYRHLLRALESANLIRLTDRTGFEVIKEVNPISILYLEPTGDGTSSITFSRLADFVGKKQDELSQRFSQSLREWASTTAGANGI